MGIFDKFKRKKDEQPQKVSEKKARIDAEIKPAEVEQKKPVKAAAKTVAARGVLAFKILQKPVITEKTTMLSGSGKYVFHVHPDSNKSEVGKAVESAFKVHVTAVNIVKVSGKKRRYGRTQGHTKGWKKAIVTLQPGQRIEGITATETA
jgi:large subunit ribosomal protein L23